MLFISIFMLSFTTFVFGNDYVSAEEKSAKDRITVKLRVKEGRDFFELITPPVEKVNRTKLTNTSKPIEVRLDFEMPVQVIDIREEHDGWELSVSSSLLKKKGGTYTLPKGTVSLEPLKEIRAINPNAILPTNELHTTTVIDDGSVLVASAEAGEGMGSFELDFGEKPLILNIDQNIKETGTFEAVLSWGLQTRGGDKRIIKEESFEITLISDQDEDNIKDSDNANNKRSDKQGNQSDEKAGDNSSNKTKYINTDHSSGNAKGKKNDRHTADDSSIGAVRTVGTIHGNDQSDDSGHVLPKTATNVFNLMFIGALILLSGFIILFILGRKKDKEEKQDIEKG